MSDNENEYDYNDGFLVKDDDEEYIIEEEDEEEFDLDDEDFVLVFKNNSSENLSSFLEKVDDEDKRNEIKEFKTLLDKCSNKEKYYESFHNMSKENKGICMNFLNNLNTDNESLIIRLMVSKIPDESKKNIWNTIKPEIENSNNSGKYTVYLSNILQIPFGKYSKNKFYDIEDKKQFLCDARTLLDSKIYGHEEPKHYMIKYLSNALSNKSLKGKVLSFVGFPGIGKTTFVEYISEILDRPFDRICLGGYGDVSSLEGHNYTYEGSRPGKLVNILQKCGVMNPIISLDEIDKVAKEDVINFLIHILDPIQNKHFQDKYFGDIDIDLSQVTWILTYNDSNAFSNILKDRITEIKLDGFTEDDKISICKEFLIPKFNKNYPFILDFKNNLISYLINSYTRETGVRKIKEIIEDIFNEVNYQVNISSIKKQKKYSITTKNISKYFKYKAAIIPETVHSDNEIGKINGLYASTFNGYGGIIPIETSWFPSDSILKLKKTGNKGKIMKESDEVSITVAWNFIPDKTKVKLRSKWNLNKEGIHIHCSEASSEKEGPSAGLATTIAIISLLLGAPIKNNIGVTGEIDLSGNILPIGGLREKFYGAKRAGCNCVIFPSENKKDYDKIVKENKELFKNGFKVKPVKSLKEAINFILVR